MNSYNFRGKSPIFMGIVYCSLISILLIELLPIFYVITMSFASKTEIITRGFFLIPKVWTTDAYLYLLDNRNFMNAFKSSVTITSIGTLFSMLLTTLMAYGLSKPWLKGRTFLNFIVLFTMLFSGGIIPVYLLVMNLNLIDSYWSLFLTGAIIPFNLIIMRSFFQSFPVEVEESARIDGCNEITLLWKIVLPLSMPVIATISLFYVVEYWNTYFNAILYLNDSTKAPLQVFLRQMLTQSDSSQMATEGGFEFSPAVRMAAVLFTAVPLLVIYPFLQKHFNKGAMLGSVKG